jgi:GTP cyclohydrolase I
MRYDEMVIERNINVQSNCEHHFVVIDGLATVAYIPKDKVLGLSKINRVVEYFSKRPQIQERLTEQIYHALQYILGTDNIAVVIDAQHFCVKSRGVEDVGSSTTTSKLGGVFKSDPSVRLEFMNIVNSCHKK